MPLWISGSFVETDLPSWKTITEFYIDSPMIIFWPPTKQQFDDDTLRWTSNLGNSRLALINILCAWGQESMEEAIQGTDWEEMIEGNEDFYYPDNSGVYEMVKDGGGEWKGIAGDVRMNSRWAKWRGFQYYFLSSEDMDAMQ